jgi:hypothetical protein
MTNMGDIPALVDRVAVQNDRWLFIATLVLALCGMIFFWRWLTNDREKLAVRLTDITDRHIEAGQKLGEVVANNTVVMRECTDTMRSMKDSITYCRARDR